MRAALARTNTERARWVMGWLTSERGGAAAMLPFPFTPPRASSPIEEPLPLGVPEGALSGPARTAGRGAAGNAEGSFVVGRGGGAAPPHRAAAESSASKSDSGGGGGGGQSRRMAPNLNLAWRSAA